MTKRPSVLSNGKELYRVKMVRRKEKDRLKRKALTSSQDFKDFKDFGLTGNPYIC